MNRLTLAALTLFLTRPAFAAPVPDILENPAALMRWTPVVMTVRADSNRYEVLESSLGIEMSGYKESAGAFYFMGWVEGGIFNVSVRPVSPGRPQFGYDLSGPGILLNLAPYGSGLSLSGHVDFTQISLILTRTDDDRWRLWGQGGLDLEVRKSGNTLSLAGIMDLERFDKKSLAVLGTAMAAAGSMPKIKPTITR